MSLPRFSIRTLMVAVMVTAVLLAFEPEVLREVEWDIRLGRWASVLVFLVLCNTVLFVVGVNIGLILFALYVASKERQRK